MSGKFILITGCSGGGKSSVLAELARRGFATFEEPGRQIVKEQLAIGGDALPWHNAQAFIELALARSLENLEKAAQSNGPAFFDRGIVDAYNYFLQNNILVPSHFDGAVQRYRYRQIFLFPPWKEIFQNDPERRHTFGSAVAEYESLIATCARLGYEALVVPKLPVGARADYILERLGPDGLR